MSLPKTYKRAVFRERGASLTIEDVELAQPKSGVVLVKVEACGVCYSDKYAQYNSMGGGFPIVPGHEIIGHIVAVGDNVSSWNVGDRVGGAWHGGHDGTCGACKKGLYQVCDIGSTNGITRDGGYAEYCTLRAEAAVPIPAQVDAAKYAPILCAGVTVFNSIRKLNVQAGSTVAVQGLGGLGHLALQYANKFGYRVVAISRDSKKEEFTRKLGAHEYIDESKVDAAQALRKLGGADLIVTTAPSADSISPLLHGLAHLGKLLVLSIPGDLSIDTGLMLNRGLSVHSWPSGNPNDSADAITFTELQNVDCMIEKFPISQANEAYNAMLNGSVRFRAVITMG